MVQRFAPRTSMVFACAIAWTFWQSPLTCAQQAVLPADWHQMSPTDFASSIRTMFTQDTFKTLSPTDQQAAKDHGKDLFAKIDLANTSLNYQTVEMLHWLARYLLDSAEVETAKTAILARQDNWTGKPYGEIRAKVVMMMRLDVPDAAIINEARRWVQAGGTFQQVPKADLQYDIVRQAFADGQVVNSSFSVAWSGFVTAPQTGDYMFLLSPINVNSSDLQNPVKFAMTVSLGGTTIITSTPNSTSGQSSWPDQRPWVSESNFVKLTAGQPVAVQVTAAADFGGKLPLGLLHAILMWKGPGMSTTVIPADRFTQAAGGNLGLITTYTWQVNGKPQLLTRIEPTVDVAWTNPAILLSKDLTIANQAADAMWDSGTSPDFIKSLVGPPAKLHPFIKDEEDTSAGLTTARRIDFLDLVLQNSTLLDGLDPKGASGFYRSFRIGTPEKALDVFGAWATRHPEIVPEVSEDRFFDADNQNALTAMAIYTTLQMPGQSTRLQNDFLQLPDGRCSLPVAYVLSFSYLAQRKLSDWIAFLDAKIADPTVVGDFQVNWFIARAHAEQLVRNPSKHFPVRWSTPAEWPTDGMKYLNQAFVAAQSVPVKMRVAQEIVARMAWDFQFKAATDLIQQLSSSVPNDQKAILASWQQKLDTIAQSQSPQAQSAAANQSYLQTLQARRAQAVSKGDSEAVSRYDSLINAAKSHP